MRVSIYSPNYAPEPTGIPFYNTGMAVWMRRRLGWQVTVHAGIPHYPWWKVPAEYAGRDFRAGRADEVMDGVVVERVPHFVPTPPVKGVHRILLDATYLWRTFLRSFDRHERPDVIVLIAPPFLSGLLGLFLRWRLGVPLVYHVQDLQVDAAMELGMLPRWIAGLMLCLERVILAHVDQVTTISAEMRRRIAAKGALRQPIAMFPNWADTEHIRPWTGDNRFRAAWGAGPATPVVMYSGNLGKKQGVDLLLEAAAGVPGCLLVVAGAGAELAELKARAATLPGLHVRFESLVPAEDLREFLAAADIHCIPQRRAAAGTVMPSKLLNIMAVGKPVVVTAPADSDLAREVAGSGCGLVVEPEDAGLLSAALAELCADPGRRRSMGDAGRRHVCSRYGVDAVLSRFSARLACLVLRRRAGTAPTPAPQPAPSVPARGAPAAGGPPRPADVRVDPGLRLGMAGVGE